MSTHQRTERHTRLKKKEQVRNIEGKNNTSPRVRINLVVAVAENEELV